MTRAAAALLADARAAGVNLTLGPDDTLKAAGAPAAVAHWSALLRPHKAALVAMLNRTKSGQDHAPCWRWLVTLPTGERFSLTSAPPMTRAEVAALHPGALVEVEQDPVPGPSLEPTARHLEATA